MNPADSQLAELLSLAGDGSPAQLPEGEAFVLPSDRLPLRPLSMLWERCERDREVSIAARVNNLPGRARLVEVRAGTGGGPVYLPGVLALRWALECSGFDVMDSESPDPRGDAGGGGQVEVVARRSTRRPLLFATLPSPRPRRPPETEIGGGRVLEIGGGSGSLEWRKCDPELLGRFDVVRCVDVLTQEDDPGALLSQLFELTAPAGTAIVGAETIADPTLADTLGFLPPSYRQGGRWRWIPGPVALERLSRQAGFVELRRLGDPPSGDDRDREFAYASFALRRR